MEWTASLFFYKENHQAPQWTAAIFNKFSEVSFSTKKWTADADEANCTCWKRGADKKCKPWKIAGTKKKLEAIYNQAGVAMLWRTSTACATSPDCTHALAVLQAYMPQTASGSSLNGTRGTSPSKSARWWAAVSAAVNSIFFLQMNCTACLCKPSCTGRASEPVPKLHGPPVFDERRDAVQLLFFFVIASVGCSPSLAKQQKQCPVSCKVH